MSQNAKIVIYNADENQILELQDFISTHLGYELSFDAKEGNKTLLRKQTLKTKAGQVLNLNLLLKRISDIFITVGIPAHIKGYQFLREAIKLTIQQPEIINSITKHLYPDIAKEFNTSPSKVERAIRHAIEVGWSRGKIENINSIFGVKVYSHNDRPTNGEFIALIADKLLVDGFNDKNLATQHEV